MANLWELADEFAGSGRSCVEAIRRMKQKAVDNEFPSDGYRVKSVGKFVRVVRSERKILWSNKLITVPEDTTIKFRPAKRVSEVVYEFPELLNGPRVGLDLNTNGGPFSWYAMLNGTQIDIWPGDNLGRVWEVQPTIDVFRNSLGTEFTYLIAWYGRIAATGFGQPATDVNLRCSFVLRPDGQHVQGTKTNDAVTYLSGSVRYFWEDRQSVTNLGTDPDFPRDEHATLLTARYLRSLSGGN